MKYLDISLQDYSVEPLEVIGGIEIWAALRALGKKGLASLIESNCENASLFAQKSSAAGYRILNDVVLNQVLVSFGDSKITKRVNSESARRWYLLVRRNRMAGKNGYEN